MPCILVAKPKMNLILILTELTHQIQSVLLTLNLTASSANGNVSTHSLLLQLDLNFFRLDFFNFRFVTMLCLYSG